MRCHSLQTQLPQTRILFCSYMFQITDCTYAHFNSSSTCPSCQRTLQAEDFQELVIADPSSATDEGLKNRFQTMFTKFSSSSNALSFPDMCKRVLKSLDDDRRVVRCLMKQIVLDLKSAGLQNISLHRAHARLKHEHTQLQQNLSSQRIQTEQTIADLQHRVQALTGTVQQQQQKIDEKDKQLAVFRQHWHGDGMTRVPSSAHSTGSSCRRNGAPGSHGHSPSMPPPSTAPAMAPPIQGFVMAKHAREQAKKQQLGEMTRSIRRGLLGGTGSHGDGDDANSIVTPIQVPPPSHQRHYQQQQRPHPPQRQQPQYRPVSSQGQIPPSTPRIRDLSAKTGYVFTSRNGQGPAKRSRMDGSPLTTDSGYGGYGRSGGGEGYPGGYGSR
jgi:TolA-binding protein